VLLCVLCLYYFVFVCKVIYNSVTGGRGGLERGVREFVWCFYVR